MISICKKHSINRLAKMISILFLICFAIHMAGLNMTAVTAAVDDYSPRPAKDGRTVFLHGDFSKNGADKSIIVIPADQNGNSKTVLVGGNGHSTVGTWDSIEMDCFNQERGYYKVTLHLKKDVQYQFKMEQKNSGGIKDVWYGLDGYMSRFDVDSFNGGSDANITLRLKHDDYVTFFFIDGDRGTFEEWQPAPPHPEYNQPGTKFHLITVSTKIRNNLQGLGNEGENNNIFDNYAGGKWRQRDAFSPVWYSLTSLPGNGEITKNGADISAAGTLYLFRRTDTGDIGIHGKWQLDNDIPNPAQDKNSDYWKNAGAFFSSAENAPKLHLTDANGEDVSFVLSYAADEKQPRHEENANNIIFEGNANVTTAGVYTCYLDEMNLDGILTDDAQNFLAYPRHPAQSIYLPTITSQPAKTENDGSITLSGQIYGQNKTAPDKNTVFILLTTKGQNNEQALTAAGFEKSAGNYQRIYTVAADGKGLWNLSHSLPAGDYTAKIFADVLTPQLIDPLSRNFSYDIYNVENTDGVNDLNTPDSYAGRPYLQDYIRAENEKNLYTEFSEAAIVTFARIYEIDESGKPVAIGTGVAEKSTLPAALNTGTRTRSQIVGTAFSVAPPASPKTGDILLLLCLIGGGIGFIILTLSIFKRVKNRKLNS